MLSRFQTVIVPFFNKPFLLGSPGTPHIQDPLLLGSPIRNDSLLSASALRLRLKNMHHCFEFCHMCAANLNGSFLVMILICTLVYSRDQKLVLFSSRLPIKCQLNDRTQIPRVLIKSNISGLWLVMSHRPSVVGLLILRMTRYSLGTCLLNYQPYRIVKYILLQYAVQYLRFFFNFSTLFFYVYRPPLGGLVSSTPISYYCTQGKK